METVVEKRTYRRYAVWFPITLTVADGEIWAICRDASPGGILVSAERTLPVGTTVSARFKVRPDEPEERLLDAKVVRTEVNQDELLLAFPYRIAIEFGATVPDLLETLQHLAETV